MTETNSSTISLKPQEPAKTHGWILSLVSSINDSLCRYSTVCVPSKDLPSRLMVWTERLGNSWRGIDSFETCSRNYPSSFLLRYCCIAIENSSPCLRRRIRTHHLRRHIFSNPYLKKFSSLPARDKLLISLIYLYIYTFIHLYIYILSIAYCNKHEIYVSRKLLSGIYLVYFTFFISRMCVVYFLF